MYLIVSDFFLSIQAIGGRQSKPVASALAAIKAGDVKVALRLLDDVGDVNVDNAALLYAIRPQFLGF